MSWSVSGSGRISEVKEQLKQAFSYPLADGGAGLADEGEKETVRKVAETIDQILDTFAPDRSVTVSAYGHMGFSDWETKAGAYQQVSMSINPAA